MTEHLPECPILKPCCDDEDFPEHGFCGNYPGGRCLHCMAECTCDTIRACEARVRDEVRSSNFTPDDHANGMTEAYHRGFDDARWISAKEALEGVQHENCDCEPCQAIARALAELRTIGQD